MGRGAAERAGRLSGVFALNGGRGLLQTCNYKGNAPRAR
jgi:hypothetical protein